MKSFAKLLSNSNTHTIPLIFDSTAAHSTPQPCDNCAQIMLIIEPSDFDTLIIDRLRGNWNAYRNFVVISHSIDFDYRQHRFTFLRKFSQPTPASHSINFISSVMIAHLQALWWNFCEMLLSFIRSFSLCALCILAFKLKIPNFILHILTYWWNREREKIYATDFSLTVSLLKHQKINIWECNSYGNKGNKCNRDKVRKIYGFFF